MSKLTYLAVLELSEDCYGIFFPDLPGCISLGDTVEETKQNAQEALQLHIHGMIRDNEDIPIPSLRLDIEDCNVVPITIESY